MKVLYYVRLAETTFVNTEVSRFWLDLAGHLSVPFQLAPLPLVSKSILFPPGKVWSTPCSGLATMTNMVPLRSWQVPLWVWQSVPSTWEGPGHLQELRMKDEQIVAFVLEEFSVWGRIKALEEIITVQCDECSSVHRDQVFSNPKLGHTLTSNNETILGDLEHMSAVCTKKLPTTLQKFCVDLYLIWPKDPETMVCTFFSPLNSGK